MKKLIYLASLCLAMSITSCEDFLTVSSPDKLTTDNFWRSQEDAEATMASAYAQLYHGDAYATSEVRWPVEAFRTDLYNMGNDAINYQTWTDINKFTYTNGNTQFSYYYQDLYRGINFANQVLEFVPKIPENNISTQKYNELIAEAHFLRGYMHMMLLLNWEEIIIRDHYVYENDPTELNIPVSDRIACWKFVVDELELGTALPAERPNLEVGRATSGAAYAYLGFAYLTRAYEEPAQEEEFLTKAWDALKEVKNYELVSGDDLINMFNGKNKNCKESIFELQYSSNTDNGARYYSYVHQFIASAELGGWDEILPSQFLVDEFKKEGRVRAGGLYDQRLYNTIYFLDEYFTEGTEKVMGQDYEYWFSSKYDYPKDDKGNNLKDEDGDAVKIPAAGSTLVDRPAFRRFTPATKKEMQTRCGFNIPLMRYANVLLMRAEILNKQGHSGQAKDIINDIRRIHGDMPPMSGTTQADVQAQIEHERIIEFPLESYRWYDLRRWGKLEQQLGSRGFVKGKHEFFPIPLWEINANPQVQ